MAAILRARGLTVRFGGLTAVDGVGFEVARGEIFGVIGPNGAGKTTLFNAIAGVQKATAGQVWLGGDEISGRNAAEIASVGLGRTFQSPALFESAGVRRNLEQVLNLKVARSPWSWLRSLGRGGATDGHGIDGILDLVELRGEHDIAASQLPYGKQKLLNIAIALTGKPKILLMDEPAAGLNTVEKLDMARLIQRIRSELGVTVLVIEHDMKLVMGISDRIMAISAGKKILAAEPETVRNDARVIEAYLGATYEFA